jgi:hypothetical protein
MQGAERQRPSALQIANIIESRMRSLLKEDGGDNSDTARFRVFDKAIAEYNGFEIARNSARVKLAGPELLAVRGLVFGVCGAAKDLMRRHLDKFKVADSAFSVDLLRQPRWLLGAAGKHALSAAVWSEALMMREASQVRFITRLLHLHTIKKGNRLTADAFNTEADNICLQSWCIQAMKSARYEITGVPMFSQDTIVKAEQLILEG